MDSKLEIKVPSEMIENVVKAEIIKQIPNKEELMTQVLVKMLNEKTGHYSNDPTYFQKAVQEMIIQETKNILAEWIEENRKGIRENLMKYLNQNKQKALKDFCESLAKHLNRYRVDVTFDLKLNY